MPRMTTFERDFAKVHGRRPKQSEFIRQEDVRRGRLVTRINNPGARLAIGAVGLFWTLVLGAAVLAMLVVAGAMVWGVLHPAHLGP